MDRLTKEQALEIAKKYAKSHNYVLGEFAGQNSIFYVWWADDPRLSGQIVGLPLYIAVDEFGDVMSDRGWP